MTETELTSFENSAGSVLRPALAIAGVANPIGSAASFALGLAFRALKLRARISKAKEDAAAGLAATVGQTGLVRVPVIVADPVAALKAVFVDDPFFPNAFPEVARQFKPEIERFKSPGAPDDVVRTMRAVNRIILPVFLGPAPRKFSNAELNVLFGDLLAMDPPDLRRIVAEFLTLDGDRNAARANEQINDDLVKLQVGLAVERLGGLQSEAETQLTAAIRQLVVAEFFGSSGAIASTARFVAVRRIDRLRSQIEAAESEIAASGGLASASGGAANKAHLAALQSSLKSLKAEKQAVESSIQ